MRTDVHAHTTFSDGSDLSAMIEAAAEADIEALGLTDHCIVTDDAFGRRAKYDLVETYEQRRAAIDAARTETDLTLYDAAEVSYVASETDAILVMDDGDVLADAPPGAVFDDPKLLAAADLRQPQVVALSDRLDFDAPVLTTEAMIEAVTTAAADRRAPNTTHDDESAGSGTLTESRTATEER